MTTHKYITIRLRKDDHKQIVKLAKADKKKPSALAREMVLHYIATMIAGEASK